MTTPCCAARSPGQPKTLLCNAQGGDHPGSADLRFPETDEERRGHDEDRKEEPDHYRREQRVDDEPRVQLGAQRDIGQELDGSARPPWP